MDLLTFGIVTGIAAGLPVLALVLVLPRRSCPGCNTVLPRFRLPVSLKEAAVGGWHCPSCLAKVARNGALLPD